MSAVSSGGPSIALSGWLVWVIVAGSVAAAVVSLSQAWIRVVRPILEGLRTLNEVVTAFTPDSKPTLPQQVTKIQGQLVLLQTQVATNVVFLRDLDKNLKDHLVVSERSVAALESHLADHPDGG